MTLIYYGANPHDGGPETVTTSAGSTTSKAVEITVNNALIRTEDEVIQACERIFVYLQQKRLNLA